MMTDLEKERAYVQAISAACPDVHIQSARLWVQEGEFNDILLVNEALIFRFLRWSENIPAFRREVQLLSKLNQVLPLPVPAPLYDSGPAAEVGQVFMGYPLLPGEPLNVKTLESPDNEALLQTLAEQLAGFLMALHQLSPAAIGIDLPVMDMPLWTRTFFEEVRQNLFVYMRAEACKSVTESFEAYFQQKDLHVHPSCLIHGDFGGANILFDGHAISGVLDFAGAYFSDPALDMASVSTYGDSFFERICRLYPLDESMCRRASFYRSLFALEEAMFGWRSGDEEAFSRGMEQYL